MSTLIIVADYPQERLKTFIIVDCVDGPVLAILDAQVAHAIFLTFLSSQSWHASFRAIRYKTWGIVALPSLIMKERRPRDIGSGMLRVEACNFFQSQPRIGNEYSFILRHILHDWPDKEAATILGNADRALGPRRIAGT
ncbi:hypothetical protein BDR03DRAFT_1051506 [Suillus americanus]|nr:hypothetical protein BDR03DRAFT_1051506 [Suillus americanus]